MSVARPTAPDDPAVVRMQRYLRELGDQKFDRQVVDEFFRLAREGQGISNSSFDFLQHIVLRDHAPRFADPRDRLRLQRLLLVQKFRPSLWDRMVMGLRNIFLLFGVFHGQLGMLFKDGTASPAARAAAREKARQAHNVCRVRLARLAPAASDRQQVYEALHQIIAALDGFAFLEQPPPGLSHNFHTILIKPGVNWGYFLYPSVSSWQSVYALTRLCFEAADARGAAVKILVGDESGIECALHEHTTTGNLAYTGIYHGAVLAGLERAAALAASQPEVFGAAVPLLPQARELADLKTRDPAASLPVPDSPDLDPAYRQMIELSQAAGVEVIAFDEVSRGGSPYVKVTVPDALYFTDGLLVPFLVQEQVTDIINLCKPPGRHLILGNTGLTGALKNYVGLVAGSERAPGLHHFTDRCPIIPAPDPESNLKQFTALHQRLQQPPASLSRRWHTSRLLASAHARDAAAVSTLHHRLVEIYLAFKARERFCVTDMRQTLRSFGPDIGDPIDIGMVLAASDAPSLDAVAAALLEMAYEQEEQDARGHWLGFLRGFLQSFRSGGPSPEAFIFGWTWLQPGTSPFDLKSHIAANSYGLGPVDCDHLDLQGLGCTCEEMLAVTSVLRRGQPQTTTT